MLLAYSSTGSQVDLGQHTFRPTHYTLRAASGSSGGHYLRTFRLQGSKTGHDWQTLHSCTDDSQSFNAPHAAHTFKIDPAQNRQNRQAFYRFFRVQLQGRTSQRRNCLSLSNFELYGQLPVTIEDEANERLESEKEKATTASLSSENQVESAAEVSAAFSSCISSFIETSFNLGIETMDPARVSTLLGLITTFVSKLPRCALATGSALRSNDVSDDMIETIEKFLRAAYQSEEEGLKEMHGTLVSCITNLALCRGELRFIGDAENLLKKGADTHPGADVMQSIDDLKTYVIERAPADEERISIAGFVEERTFDETSRLLVDPHEHSLRFMADLLETTVNSCSGGAEHFLSQKLVSIALLTKANVDAVLGTKLSPATATVQKLMEVSRTFVEKREMIETFISAALQRQIMAIQGPPGKRLSLRWLLETTHVFMGLFALT